MSDILADFCPTCGASWDCEHSARTDDGTFRSKEPPPVHFMTGRPIALPRLGDRYKSITGQEEFHARQTLNAAINTTAKTSRDDARKLQRAQEQAKIADLVKERKDASRPNT